MSLLNSCSFIFNGINSVDFGVMIGYINSEMNKSSNGLIREIIRSTKIIKVKDNIYETKNIEPIAFSFSIISVNNEEISRAQSIKINRWLLSPTLPQLLKFNDYDNYNLHYYAICTEIKDIVIGGKLLGKEIRFETNSSYAFSEKQIKSFDVNESLVFSINNSADTHDGIYYPVITLIAQSNIITIENITDAKSVTIITEDVPSDKNGNKVITLNSENLTILDTNRKLLPANKIGWNDLYSSYVSSIDKYINTIYWPRLLYGMNELKITGTCILQIEYEFPRKAGYL